LEVGQGFRIKPGRELGSRRFGLLLPRRLIIFLFRVYLTKENLLPYFIDAFPRILRVDVYI